MSTPNPQDRVRREIAADHNPRRPPGPTASPSLIDPVHPTQLPDLLRARAAGHRARYRILKVSPGRAWSADVAAAWDRVTALAA